MSQALKQFCYLIILWQESYSDKYWHRRLSLTTFRRSGTHRLDSFL